VTVGAEVKITDAVWAHIGIGGTIDTADMRVSRALLLSSFAWGFAPKAKIDDIQLPSPGSPAAP
jgi:hypothetical protein